MHAAHDELKHAHESLKAAGQAWADRVLGHETRGHLRDAARHVLKAGIAALDDDERRAAQAKTVTPA